MVDVIFLTVVVFLTVSWVTLLTARKWRLFLVSFALFVSVIVVSVVTLGPLAMAVMSGPDGFGKSHKVPDGLEYHLPLDPCSGTDVLIDSLDTGTYLQIWNGLQGGNYKYDLHYPPLPAGDVFLRCYEVTEDIPLSEDRILEASTVSVDPTGSFSKVVGQKEFTIYEGDWEDYYAARIEVWFRDSETRQERKLCEKVYRVEGWMR